MGNKTAHLRFDDDPAVKENLSDSGKMNQFRKQTAESADEKTDSAGTGSDGRSNDKKKTNKETSAAGRKRKLRTEEEQKAARRNRLRFGKKEIQEETKRKHRYSGKAAAKYAAVGTVAAVSTGTHLETDSREDDNAGTEAVYQAEKTGAAAVYAAGNVHFSRDSEELEETEVLRKSTVSEKYENASESGKYGKKRKKTGKTESSKEQDRTFSGSNPLSRWQQKHAVKQGYAAERNGKSARVSGAGEACGNYAGGHSMTSRYHTGIFERAADCVKDTVGTASAFLEEFWMQRQSMSKCVLAFVFVLVILVVQLYSCSAVATGALTTITATSWPADDIDITKADAYYTKLEAELQKKINDTKRNYSDYDEYRYSIGEIGHDPVVLISYLSAAYGAFTFREVKPALDDLFARQYDLIIETENETRTTTSTVRAGDAIGNVVTSGYCNCSICCGSWAGGPTASGVYPTANHTLAVDADHPTVPLGTEVIMNGTLYKVEDTGDFARYGVDFDVYYDEHSAAQAHGHQTWEACYAGGDGEEIEVTTSTDVSMVNVRLNSGNMETLADSLLDEDEKALYDIYVAAKGNRVIFGSPVDYNWHLNITGDFGYRCDPSGNRVVEADGLEVSLPSGTEIRSVMDGTVYSVSGNTVILENSQGYRIQYAGCSSIQVSAGQNVEMGDAIAEVSDGNRLELEFIYGRTRFNPCFYLDTGEESIYGYSGTAAPQAAALIAEAVTHLGTPYVWGGYSPDGFDCSGFVSYSLTNSGVLNTGHLTCRGLIAQCTTISKAELQPGDLVFFRNTYDGENPTHVGIYIGSGEYGTGTFIHSGDPCQYGNLNSSYWIQHWMCGGRWY